MARQFSVPIRGDSQDLVASIRRAHVATSALARIPRLEAESARVAHEIIAISLTRSRMPRWWVRRRRELDRRIRARAAMLFAIDREMTDLRRTLRRGGC